MSKVGVQGQVLEPEVDALQELIAGGNAVLVNICAPWCGPCKSMSPVVEAIAGEWPEQMKVVKIEVDNAETPANDSWAREQGVRSLPTFILFKGGIKIAAISGTTTQGRMSDWLAQSLAS